MGPLRRALRRADRGRLSAHPYIEAPPHGAPLSGRDREGGQIWQQAASCLIDGEAVACDGDGISCFDRLRYSRRRARLFLGGFKSSPAGRQLPHVSPCKDKCDYRHGRHEGKLCICQRVEFFLILHDDLLSGCHSYGDIQRHGPKDH